MASYVLLGCASIPDSNPGASNSSSRPTAVDMWAFPDLGFLCLSTPVMSYSTHGVRTVHASARPSLGLRPNPGMNEWMDRYLPAAAAAVHHHHQPSHGTTGARRGPAQVPEAEGSWLTVVN
jgi:hypothetical protein